MTSPQYHLERENNIALNLFFSKQGCFLVLGAPKNEETLAEYFRALQCLWIRVNIEYATIGNGRTKLRQVRHSYVLYLFGLRSIFAFCFGPVEPKQTLKFHNICIHTQLDAFDLY